MRKIRLAIMQFILDTVSDSVPVPPTPGDESPWGSFLWGTGAWR